TLYVAVVGIVFNYSVGDRLLGMPSRQFRLHILHAHSEPESQCICQFQPSIYVATIDNIIRSQKRDLTGISLKHFDRLAKYFKEVLVNRLLGIISHLFSPISKVGIWNRSPKVRDFMISVYLPYAHHRRFDGVVVFYSKVFHILDLGRGVTVKALEEDIQPSPVQHKTIR